MQTCKTRGNTTNNPKFCSRTCAAIHNNKLHPKRTLSNCCKKCNTPIKAGRVYCTECFDINKHALKERKTKYCAACQKEIELKDYYTVKDKFTRPSALCRECHKKRNRQLRFDFKTQCIQYKGGHCEICGYHRCTKALDFHHIDCSEKDFQISDRWTSFTDKVRNELDKCQLVCSNCHREIHA